MAEKPTVGRIVIFTPPAGFVPTGNRSGTPGNGAKEFVAIVGQVFDGADYCNLFVMPPFADAYWEGSVLEGEGPRTWRWPPRA
jgi:hypothetical protein